MEHRLLPLARLSCGGACRRYNRDKPGNPCAPRTGRGGAFSNCAACTAASKTLTCPWPPCGRPRRLRRIRRIGHVRDGMHTEKPIEQGIAIGTKIHLKRKLPKLSSRFTHIMRLTDAKV